MMLNLLETPNIWTEAPFWFLAPVGGILALLFALIFYKGLMTNTEGEPEMVRIAKAVREGAYAYLSRQRNVVIVVFLILCGVLVAMAFGDLDRDGIAELLTTSAAIGRGDTLRLWRVPPGGRPKPVAMTSTPHAVSAIAMGDIDQNGIDEFLVMTFDAKAKLPTGVHLAALVKP